MFNFSANSTHGNWNKHLIYPAVAIWGLLFTFSMVGNSWVCILSYRRCQLLGIKTYYFLSLAIADLVFTLTTLFYVLNVALPDNIYSNFTCKAFYYIINTSHGASVLNLLLLTYNRYYAVIYPIKEFSNRSKKTQVIRKVLATWFVALIPYIPLLFIYKVGTRGEDGLPEKRKYCAQNKQDSTYLSAYYGLLVLLMYLIPLCLIIIAYSRICVRLFLSTKRPDCTMNRGRSKAIKLLIIIAALFFILWTPFNTMLVIIFVLRIEFQNLQLAWALSSMLVLINASINPWLYILVGRQANRRPTPINSPGIVRLRLGSL